MPERVPATGGGDRDVWPDRVEERLARGITAAVVAEHEGLGPDLPSPLEDRALAGMPEIARDDQSVRSSADDRDERSCVAVAARQLACRGDDPEGNVGRSADGPGRREDDSRSRACRAGSEFGQPGACRVAGRDP
jgi:hypothetical protein